MNDFSPAVIGIGTTLLANGFRTLDGFPILFGWLIIGIGIMISFPMVIK